jgi:hypothetical protein
MRRGHIAFQHRRTALQDATIRPVPLKRIQAMTKTLSFAAVLAMGLLMGAGTRGAQAASPAGYCTFTSPASVVCPAEAAPPARVASSQVATDHCVALTPASSACPAAPAVPVSVASSSTETFAQLKAGRN